MRATMLIGIEKPMPSLPPELLAMAVFRPTTSPRRFTSGPPLLPGLMAASVWMKFWSSSSSSPRSRLCRPLALTMPRVTLWLRPNGLPTASTKSPISSAVAVAEAGGDQVRCADGHDGDVGVFVAPDLVGMSNAAVGQVDADQFLGRVPDDVAVGEHVEIVAELDDDAGAGLFDVEQAAVFGEQRRLDVDDAGSDQLHDPLDQAEFAVERIDVAREGGEFAVALGG